MHKLTLKRASLVLGVVAAIALAIGAVEPRDYLRVSRTAPYNCDQSVNFTGTVLIGGAAPAAGANLTALAGLTGAANKIPYFTGLGTMGTVSSSANMISLLGSADYATARTNLGLAIGTNVQAYDADLTTWAGVTPSANGQSLVAAADYSGMRTLLSLRPGTDVQAADNELSALAGITSAANTIPYFTGSGTAGGITSSANMISLLGSADYSAARTALSLVPGTNVQAYDADLTTWAGVTPSANGQSLVSAANYAAMRGLLDLEPGTDYIAVPGSSAQGDILYHNGTSWTRLAAGTSGYYLKTNGAAADPAWAALSALPSGTQGDVLYYNGSAWVVLGYGTSGYFLKTNGAGANPAWAEAPGAVGGEANTGANAGVGGVGVFYQKSSTELQFKNVNAGSSKITVTDDTGNHEIDIDVAGGTANGDVVLRPAAESVGADHITEITSAHGVIVDGLTIKDAGFAIGSDADGDTYYRASGALARLAKGTANQVLAMNSGATAPEWQTRTRTGVYRTLYIDAGAMVPSTTNGATTSTSELATNKQTIDGFDFDAATEQYTDFKVVFPDEWDRSTIKAKVYWSNGETSGTGDVVWGLKAVACSNDDALDASFGTAVEVTDTALTDGDAMVTAATGALTVGGTPALGDLVQFRAYRKAADGADTYDKKARLLGVVIQYAESTTEASAW